MKFLDMVPIRSSTPRVNAEGASCATLDPLTHQRVEPRDHPIKKCSAATTEGIAHGRILPLWRRRSGPPNSASWSRAIERVQSSLGIRDPVEIDVAVLQERRVIAGDRTDLIIDLVQHGLGDVGTVVFAREIVQSCLNNTVESLIEQTVVQRHAHALLSHLMTKMLIAVGDAQTPALAVTWMMHDELLIALRVESSKSSSPASFRWPCLGPTFT